MPINPNVPTIATKIEDFSCEQHDHYHPYKYHRNTAEDDDGFAIIFEQHDEDGNHQNDG